MLIYEAFLLIWHDIGRKDSLLSLFAFEFEGCQRAQLIVHTPIWRRWILAGTDASVLIAIVHAGVHRVVPDGLLRDLRAVIIMMWRRFLIARRLQVVGVYRTEETFLELDALGDVGSGCLLLLLEDGDGAWWACRVHEARLNRIQLKVRRSHALIDLRQTTRMVYLL